MTKEQEEAIKICKNINAGMIYFANDKECEEFPKAIETVLSMLKEKDKEIEKKDKQIDLMANYIVDLIKYNNPEEKREVEEIKQYFERKVEEC